jgi:flagellar basal body-associated protein FliL
MVLACPTSSRKRPTNNPAPEPARPAVLIDGRLRWLHRLTLVAWWHATMPTVPQVQGRADRPARQQERTHTMTEAAMSFAGNLTDQPEVRYTETGIRIDIGGQTVHPTVS